jgi:hypothetical protein
VSDDVRRVTTEAQRERFHLARRRGGQCVACGRALSADETVYIERFEVGPVAGRGTTALAAVGVECASPGFVDEMQGREPERCAGCGRGVYYRRPSTRRRQALCSRACGVQVQVTKVQVAKQQQVGG